MPQERYNQISMSSASTITLEADNSILLQAPAQLLKQGGTQDLNSKMLK